MPLLLLWLSAAAAHGNGRYPAAAQLARDPSDAAHLLVQTTYGFLQTTDSGATWHWICEVAIGYDGQEDPFVGILGNGTMLAATSQGLAKTVDRGCGWQKITAPEHLGRLPAIDLVVNPQDALHVIVLNVAADQLHHELTTSHDGGQTWQALGAPLPQNAAGLTLEIAPSRPQRLYVSGRIGADQDQHALLRSDDGGLTWTALPFDPTMTDANGEPLPADQTQVLGTYIGAIDPQQPETVWLRVRRSFNPDQLWRTQDGGATWQLAFQAAKGKLAGFALSPDGQQVAIGAATGQPGLWRAKTADLKFERVNDVSTSCLKWLDSGLYVCADELLDGMTIGVSVDNGATFTAVHRRADLTPLVCAETSRTAQLCGKAWPLLAYQLGVGEDNGGSPPAKSGCQATPDARWQGVLLALATLLATVQRVRRLRR